MTDVEAALADRRARRRAGTLVEAPTERTPEILAMEDELFRQHLDAWIDQQIPALGHRTPRQAAKSAGGRERLEALLGSFDEHAATMPASAAEHLAALRTKLGLVR